VTWRGRALAALWLSFLAGFVRSTTVPDRPDQGKPLFWKDARATFYVNATGFRSVPGCASAAAAADLARRSFLTWSEAARAGESQPCTSFRFVDGGDTTRAELGYDATPGASNVNLVAFREGLCASITSDPDCQGGTNADLGACIARHDCWSHDAAVGPGGTLALTTVTYRSDSGEILDADLEVNGWNGDVVSPTGWYLTCSLPPAPSCPAPPYGKPDCIEIDVGNTVTHEAGHVLGLDHVCVPSYPKPFDACPTVSSPNGPLEPVMAPTALVGDTDKRQLKPDDVDGVCSIYPPAGGCGCRSGGGGGALALLALGFSLWRRRSQRAGARDSRTSDPDGR
jgi:MYXO-CTERM domain-containing protein